MSEVFVKLPIEAKRVDILSRMDVLHDKLVLAREALNVRKEQRKTTTLHQEDNTLSLQLNQVGPRTTYSSIATETKFGSGLTVPTCTSQYQRNMQSSRSEDISLQGQVSCNPHEQRRYLMSEPIIQGKENSVSPHRHPAMFKSPQRRVNRNTSSHKVDCASPVALMRQQLNGYTEQNLLSESDEPTHSYPLQLVSQNSLSTIPRQSCSNKNYSTGSILSGEKSQYTASNPRFKLSNRYLELSGCQWQSALMEQEDVNDFDESGRSRREYKQISFIPSIFQKKTIRPKKKKTNTKEYIQITGDIRDKVANMIKQRLKLNQQPKETLKREKNPKQSYNEFLQAADLQKKLKDTLVKKVGALNGFPHNK